MRGHEKTSETIWVVMSRHPSCIGTVDRELATLLHGVRAGGATVGGLGDRILKIVAETLTVIRRIHVLQMIVWDGLESLFR